MSDEQGQGSKGMTTAIDAALEAFHAQADEEDRQFGLFAEPLTEAGKTKALVYKRGPGRPPGSRNRRTERTAAFLLTRHRDPREILLEIAEANPHDLAALLGCTAFEAMQEKRLAAIGVLPYIAAKKPIEIDVTKRSVVYLNIVEGAAVQASDEDEGVAMGITVLDGVEYQQTGETVQRGVLGPPRPPRQVEPERDHNNFPPGVTKLSDW
jgi:hypothetical protein